jgi:hypothetical protein
MRIDQIRYIRTLDYCDGISIFEASDPIGGTYVASYLEAVNGGDRYLVVGCPPESLRLFRHGQFDLRELLTESSGYGWYIADFLGLRKPLDIKRQDSGGIPSEFLPEPGYTILDSVVDHEIVKDALDRDNFVLQVSIEPPETNQFRAVSSGTVNSLINRVQELARRVAEEVDGGNRRGNASRLNMVGVSEGSVIVTLQGASGLDERRESVLTKTFERIDDLFDKMEGSQDSELDVVEYEQTTIEAYVKLMKLLKDENTGFHYTWASPEMKVPSHRAVSLDTAQTLERELPNALARISLETPQIEVVVQGTLIAANQLDGKWVIRGTGSVLKRGVVEEGGPSLDDLVIGRQYAFACLEKWPETNSRRSRKPTLHLQAITML